MDLRRQRSAEDFSNTSKRKHGLDRRRSQSFHIGTDTPLFHTRRRKVSYRPKSKMKIVTFTLSSQEKTPSPGIFTGLDIDVKGSDFKKLCSPKLSEKSVKFFFDSSKDPINADAIVKENKKEVKTIPINKLLDIQDKTNNSLLGKQVNLKASQPDWSPHIRLYDHNSGYLCERELQFLQTRKINIHKALRNLFDDKEEIHEKSVPHIALMGSGGGYRAMIAMSGIVNALYNAKLFDCILYISTLSGSSWYTSYLYSNEGPNIDPKEVQNNIQIAISKNPISWSNLFRSGWESVKGRISEEDWNWTMNVFGPLLRNSLISDRETTRWSKQVEKLSGGKAPLPLLAVINAKVTETAKEFHEWVEFSPYEVTISKYGAAIDMKLLGSEFSKGVLTGKKKEPPLWLIMSICGSAFTIIRDELRSKESKPVEPQNEEYDQLDGPGLEPIDININQSQAGFIESKPVEPQNEEYDQLDGPGLEPIDININQSQAGCTTELTDEEIIDLENSFATICKIMKDDDDENNNGGDDDIEIDGPLDYIEQFISFFTNPIMSKFKEWLKEWFVVNDRRGRAALVNNFMKDIPFEANSQYKGSEHGSDENYLQEEDPEKLCLIDAGLAFNSPYPLLFQPGRDIDLILSFDFTDRIKDENSPFEHLLLAEQWARTHDIKFPNIASNIEKYNGKKVQELYVFENEFDPECPIIMHFVLVNNDFRKFKKPGQRRDPEEQEFANFNIYDDQKTFHMTNFQYNKENFDRLSLLSEFIVLNNLEEIKDCIKKSIQKRNLLESHKREEKLPRKRHPTT